MNQAIWSSGKSAKIGTRRKSDAATILLLHLTQVLMNELHGNRPFSNTRSHPLHRAMANVAHGEDSWNVGFQQEGISLQRPTFRSSPVPQEIGSGQNEPALVALDCV